MDRENIREVRRGGGGGSASNRSSPAKRHLRVINSSHSNSNGKAPSYSPSAWDNEGEVEGEVMEKWREERPKGARWRSSNKAGDGEMDGGGSSSSGGGSDGEEACLARSAAAIGTNTSINSRKKPRIYGKVSEDCNAVDLAVVPRKLRSAINKRRSQSASPPSSAVKRHHVTRAFKVSNDQGTKRSNKNMFNDVITEEEEEVAEALSSLASMVLINSPAKITDNSRVTEEISEGKQILEAKATSHDSLEASKEEVAKVHSPCTDDEATNLSLGKPLNKIEKAETSGLEQPVIEAGNQKLNSVPSGNFEPDMQGSILLSKNEKVDNSSKTDNPPNLLCISSQFSSGNGLLQSTQVEGIPVHKPDIGLWPFGPSVVQHELQSFKPKPANHALHMPKEEVAPVRHGLPNGAHRHMPKMSSSKALKWLGFSTSGTGLTLTGNDCPTEKAHPLTSERSWKRCILHVFIGHLIQNHQNVEKKHQLSLTSSQLKGKEVPNSCVPAADEVVGPRNGMNGVVSAGSNGFIVERNHHDARIHVLQDGKLLQAQQASSPSGVYAQQKQARDFLPLSASGETENDMKASRQLPVPYQIQHHTLVPFPFPHVSYSNSYPDQLAAGANQQLQVPHFMGNPFYGPHMVHSGGAAKHQLQQQQQQIWQAHQGQYRPPLAVPKWQNGRQHGPFPSILPRAQPPPVACHPPPSASMFAGSGPYPVPHLQQPHQFMHIPPPSSSSRSKRQHHHQEGGSGGGFGPEGPPQLQLLCNADHT